MSKMSLKKLKKTQNLFQARERKTYFLARKQRAVASEANNFADKEIKGPIEEEVLHLKEKLDELSAKIHNYEQMEEAIKHKESLSKLYERGIINLDEEYVE